MSSIALGVVRGSSQTTVKLSPGSCTRKIPYRRHGPSDLARRQQLRNPQFHGKRGRTLQHPLSSRLEKRTWGRLLQIVPRRLCVLWAVHAGCPLNPSGETQQKMGQFGMYRTARARKGLGAERLVYLVECPRNGRGWNRCAVRGYCTDAIIGAIFEL